MDLFALGSSGEVIAQVHDYNGGIHPNGLFWTVGLPQGSFNMSANGKHARLHAKGVPLIDTFQFAGPNVVPGTVDLDVRWDAVGPALAQGSGSGVDQTDPAAFLGNFAQARAVGDFAGSDLGFSFRSDPGASSDLGYAEIGTEHNGQFL